MKVASELTYLGDYDDDGVWLVQSAPLAGFTTLRCGPSECDLRVNKVVSRLWDHQEFICVVHPVLGEGQAKFMFPMQRRKQTFQGLCGTLSHNCQVCPWLIPTSSGRCISSLMGMSKLLSFWSLEHTGVSLGPELAYEQVGGESCQDGERYQAAGESPACVAPGCQPGSGLGRAAAFLGQHFHTGCFPEAQPQILCHALAGPGDRSDSPWAERPSII